MFILTRSKQIMNISRAWKGAISTTGYRKTIGRRRQCVRAYTSQPQTWRLKKGIQYEKDNGYKNVKGREMTFDRFLISQVESVLDSFVGAREDSSFRELLELAKSYNQHSISKRKKTCQRALDLLLTNNSTPAVLEQRAASQTGSFPYASSNLPSIQRQSNVPSGLDAVTTQATPQKSRDTPETLQTGSFLATTAEIYTKDSTQARVTTNTRPSKPNSTPKKSRGVVKDVSKASTKSVVELDKRFLKKMDPLLAEDSKYVSVGLDIETNGFEGEVLELACMNYNTGDMWHTLINPGMGVRLDPRACEIHKITQSMLNEHGVPSWSVAAQQFLAWLAQQKGKKNLVLYAHNGVLFDFKRLTSELEKLNLSFNPDWYYFDSYIFLRHLQQKVSDLPERLKQETLREYFKIPNAGQAHRADADVIVLGKIMAKVQDPSFSGMGDLSEIMDYPSNFAGQFSRKRAGGRKGGRDVRSSVSNRKSQSVARKKVAVTVEAEEKLLEVAGNLVASNVPWNKDPLVGVERAVDGMAGYDNVGKENIGDFGEMIEFLSQPVSAQKFWTTAQRKALEKAGFSTVLQVAQYFPREYVEYSTAPTEFVPGEMVAVSGILEYSKASSFRSISTAVFDLLCMQGDTPISVRATKFFSGGRGVFAAKTIVKQHELDSEMVIKGKVDKVSNGIVCLKEPMEFSKGGDIGESHIEPIYPARTPLKAESFKTMDTKKQGIIPPLLKELRRAAGIEFLPDFSVKAYKVDGVNWYEALSTLHRPKSTKERELARKRFAFQDMLFLQLLLLARRSLLTAPKNAADGKGTCITNLKMMKAGKRALPYKLTDGQEESLEEILEDLVGPTPMLRLLQGDVGSGKTAVAFLAMMAAVGSGYQAALMAPIEVLAHQHYENLRRLIDSMPRCHQASVEILTGSTRVARRREILSKVASGKVKILIGTHALLSEGVDFKKLGFVVVDEQHRFGVDQREKLQKSDASAPHILMMSATPIPRTLALVLHGTMVVSYLKDSPPGRKPVYTQVVDEGAKKPLDEMYTDARKEIDQGGRVFMVYPLIGESTSERMADVKCVEQEYEKMKHSKFFAGYGVGLLHGRMPSKDKAAAIQKFTDGTMPVLVATTVIEVGMDVTDASMMIVHHAERFGLAQLHQLRGRVGRGQRPSKCYLVTTGGPAMKRLRILEQSTDGHDIAEADLKLRGPGDLLGSKQSGHMGLFTLSVAELLSDGRLVDTARVCAAQVLASNNGQIPETLQKMLMAQGFPPVEEFDV